MTDVGSFKSYQLSEGRTTPVSARVSPTGRIRGEIDAPFDGPRELSEIIEDIARLGARLIIQTAVEAEVDMFLGRARYQRAADCQTRGSAAVTAIATRRSRPPPGRSRWRGRSCVAPPRRSPHSCS